MNDVVEWIYEFAGEHINRFQSWQNVWPRLKGPDGKPTLDAIDRFSAWAGNFAARGVTFDIARLASAEMAAKEPQLHPGQHEKRIMDYIDQVWARRDAENRTGAAPQTREYAEAAARHCPECAGSGYAVRPIWHERHNREYNVTMFCLCLYGEWLAVNFAAKGPDADEATRSMKARTRRLAQYPELWDRRWHTDNRGNDRWPVCWPLNPVPRDWAIEPCWIADRYGTAPAEVEDESQYLNNYEEIRLRVTGKGPRPLI